MRTIIVILALVAFGASPASAWYHPIYHHHHHHIMKASKSATGGATGGAACTGGCPWAVGFIAAVAVAIVWHEMNGPACARPGAPNGYDTPTLWRPYCAPSRNVVSVRG